MAFTYFFRDNQTLDLICEHVLPVLKTKQKISIWDAGLAMGPEPYSLAMTIREKTGYMYFRNISILATDIDAGNSFGTTIKKASYPWEMLQRIERPILEKYFISEDKGYFALSDEVKSRVDFLQHDLLTMKPIKKNFNLIMCKNVLLHFTEKQRSGVIHMFHDALETDGYLVMEATQMLPETMQPYFEQIVTHAKIFKKKRR